MLNAREICTDATVIRTNGKQSFIRNFSTEKSVVYYSSKKKDLETLEQFWILKEYAGTLTHDHETALYYFGVVKDVESIPAKVVYVRNRNKRKESLCLISTDTTLDENEIIRIYGKRWDIEVFFKVCKSYLNLGRECSSLSYDAMTAHTAVVFTRYMMLSLESRESGDNRSLGELFLYFSDEMADITWIQAFQMLLQMFRSILKDNTELSEEKINELVAAFMNTLPVLLKTQLQAA